MSVGYPIDVTRLLGDNQRFQRDLSVAHQLQHQLRTQLDQNLAANQALRAQCEQLQRQKQEGFNNSIANQRQFYENETSALRLEREQLIRKIKQHERQQPDLRLLQTIQNLNRQIQRHEKEKRKIEKDLASIKKLMAQQEEEFHKKINQEIKQKQFKIKQLQSMNIDLKNTEQALRNEVNEGKIQKQVLEPKYLQLKQQYQHLQADWKYVAGKTSAGILEQLIKIRNQNLALRKQINAGQLSLFTNDEAVYSLLQKLHEELAIARYQLTQTQNARSRLELNFQEERTQFRNEKAEKDLNIIKLQKQLAFTKAHDKQLKQKFEKLDEKLKGYAEETQIKEKTEEEIALLKIKVFVLQSLRGSQKYRKKDELNYLKYEAQFQAFEAFKLKSSRIDVLKNVSSMHVAMSETIQRLKQEQSKKRDLTKKWKDYKSRWESVSKRQSEALRTLERHRQKQAEYQKLIQKMQKQLEKAYLASPQSSQRQNIDVIINSYQQKLSFANNQIILLKNQLGQYEQNTYKDKRSQQKEIYKLNTQVKQTEQNYNAILQKNRSLQNKLLQQTLSAATSKIGKNYQAELAEKTAALIMTQQELLNLRDQLMVQKQNNQQNLTTISRLQDEISRLNRQASSPSAFQHEINYLQQKLAFLEGVLGEQRHVSSSNNDNHIRNLYEQIAQLKTETQESKHDSHEKSDRAHAQNEIIQSYRSRLLELEQALRGIANENQQKSIEIFRLNEQNNLLSKQLDKIQQELDVLRGKAGSMREIDLIDRNKQLEDELASIQHQKTKIQQSLHLKTLQADALRKQCEEYWSDNLKLLVIIKENNVQLKQNRFLSEKYDHQINNRQQQLESRIQSLQNENEILKNLVQDLRKSILEKQTQKQHQQSSKKSDLVQLRKELQVKQRQSFYFQEQLNRLLQQRAKEKGIFDVQWSKLITQINQLKQQLNKQEGLHKKQYPVKYQKFETLDQQSRIKILLAQQQQQDEITLINLRKMVAQLQKETVEKDEKIEQLQSELSQFQFSFKRSGIFDQQVIEQRNQVQTLMQGRFKLEDKIRILQQENSLLKIRRISEDVQYPPTYSQQTFGPSVGTGKLIQQLRQSETGHDGVSMGQLKSWNDRYEQALCILVLTFAQIQSLRIINEQLKEKMNIQYQEYTQKMRHIEESLNRRYSPQIDMSLIRELECGHRHLMEMTNQNLKQVTVGAQLGSFTSITGGKMIESYEVPEDESITSQDIINM